MVNRINGNRFEAEFCEELADKGYWAHNMAQNQSGQPADIIAVRNQIAYLIDCKDCKNDRFPLSRIEPNQQTAMTMWTLSGNDTGWFALKLTDGNIYMLSYNTLDFLKQSGKASLNKDEIIAMGHEFEDWSCSHGYYNQ